MRRNDLEPLTPESKKDMLAGAMMATLLYLFLFGMFYQGEELCSRQVKEAGERAVDGEGP